MSMKTLKSETELRMGGRYSVRREGQSAWATTNHLLTRSVIFRAFDGNTYGAYVCKIRKGIAKIEYFAKLSNGEEIGVNAYLDRKDWNRLTPLINT